MAQTAYNSPGITVTETVNPSLAPLLANPSVVGIVGPALGYQTAIERLVLTNTTPVTLKYTGVNSAVVSVVAVDGTSRGAGNYVITAGADPDTTISGDIPYTIARFGNPATAPTLAAGTGTLVGTYHYAISFVNSAGETGIGPTSSPITAATTGVSLSAIPVGPTGTTARNIYREKVISTVGQGFHLVATIADNTTAILANETTTDSAAALLAAPPAGISSGDTAVVSYQYTDQFYFLPTTMDNFKDITDKYGAPYDNTGNISSQLTFAARLALLNGASEVILVASATSSESDMLTALAQLESVEEIRFVSVTTGTTGINSDVIAHVNKMNGQGLYRQAVLGVDGSAGVLTVVAQRATAQGINNEAIQLVNSTCFYVQNPVTLTNLAVGGQYAAIAATGMWAGRDVQFPLTRKTVAGFVDIKDKRTASDEALDSSAGLLVIGNRGGSLVVRHSVTTAVGDINSREGSVVRAKYDMVHQLSDTLNASIIGLVLPADQAPITVQGAVGNVLQQLIVQGSIESYDNLSARVLPSDPTTVEASFSYSPAYPINNISIVFQIDTTTGSLTLTQ